ncbi:MAG: hypothetical protein PF440_01105 [Thiomicrorhabdus sp.]|jgi:hypothetical protein|nr:hypothetical protein [Thiomicrorhabdus sp.]
MSHYLDTFTNEHTTFVGCDASSDFYTHNSIHRDSYLCVHSSEPGDYASSQHYDPMVCRAQRLFYSKELNAFAIANGWSFFPVFGLWTNTRYFQDLYLAGWDSDSSDI